MYPSKVLFQLSGSIACYKACHVLSALVQAGSDVRVVATPASLRFVGSATLEGLSGNPVLSSCFSEGRQMDHIHLARWAELILLCPASAQCLNGLKAGLGDPLVGALFLARGKTPYTVVPAMNPEMWTHPATEDAMRTLQSWGVSFIGPAEGKAACGEVGFGRMVEPDEILRVLEGPVRRVLITAGGTREPIDSVRSITNMSTGKTGAQLADYFYSQGWRVTYLHGQGAVVPKVPCETVEFTSAESLDGQLKERLSRETFDGIIHLAAVGDFQVQMPFSGKLSSQEVVDLRLRPGPKIVDKISAYAPNTPLVAFKLTTDDDLWRDKVQNLMERSRARLVVHNALEDLDNLTLCFSRGGGESQCRREDLPRTLEAVL